MCLEPMLDYTNPQESLLSTSNKLFSKDGSISVDCPSNEHVVVHDCVADNIDILDAVSPSCRKQVLQYVHLYNNLDILFGIIFKLLDHFWICLSLNGIYSNQSMDFENLKIARDNLKIVPNFLWVDQSSERFFVILNF